jgi:osmotically-inducible protein OsmY
MESAVIGRGLQVAYGGAPTEDPMKLRIVALTCALSAAACGGSDSRPAQDPSSASTMTTTTAAPSDPMAASTMTNSSGANATGSASRTPPATDQSAMRTDSTATNSNAAGTATTGTGNNGAAAVTNTQGAADQTKDADNTKINERDRHDSLTPMDQSNGSSDVKISAAIRKGIMGDKTLSFAAKNVKIITVGGKVTLRGPVKSDQEKAAIEALAKQTAGVSEVDDQLEVKNAK